MAKVLHVVFKLSELCFIKKYCLINFSVFFFRCVSSKAERKKDSRYRTKKEIQPFKII